MMIRQLISSAIGFRKRIALTIIMGILRVAAELAFVWFCKRTVDIASGNVAGSIALCAFALIGIIIAELLFSTLSSRISELAEVEMRNSLQTRLFGHSLGAEWQGGEKYHSGDIMSRLADDCRVAAECLCRTVPTMIIACVQLLSAFLFMWYFNPMLAVVLLLMLPVFILVGRIFFKRLRMLNRRIRKLESRLYAKMQESIQNRILILTSRQIRLTIKAVIHLQAKRHRLYRRRTDFTLFSRMTMFTGFEGGYIVAFLWGVTKLQYGLITFGTLTAYIQLAGLIQRPVSELARLMPGFVHAQTAFSRIDEIETLPTYPVEETSELSVTPGPGGIAVRNISFSYSEDQPPVFKNFNHTFDPGTSTAIVGPTGVGKSTLFRLILGLLRPQEGEITSFPDRHQLVYVPQGNSLLSGTIRENLKLGNPDAAESEMLEALHFAAADFVKDLPDGLDTLCGERGHGLSEGQAQRIAIARGLLCKGSILLLDEISASLDEPTENILMERLSQMKGSHTMLMITHRPGAARYCDQLLNI